MAIVHAVTDSWGASKANRSLLLVPACALGVHGLVGHLLFLAGRPVPSWVLLATLVGSLLWWGKVSSPGRSVRDRTRDRALPRSAIALGVVVVLGFVAWSGWTSWITPCRSWDGLVSWSVRAQALGSPADLTRPFFADPDVYAHSRSYPLLQPLVLASLGDLVGQQTGRLFFPALYLCLLLLIFQTSRRLGGSPHWSLLCASGLACTPAWFDVGAGAIDSGYADLFLAYAIALGAAGLLLGDAALLFWACLLLPWIKPEGVVYAAIMASILMVGDDRRCFRGAVAGLGLALLVWWPLRARLSFSPGIWWYAIGVVVLLLVARTILQRWRSTRVRVAILAGGAFACLLLVILLVPGLEESSDPLLRDFATNLAGIGDRLTVLPALLLGFAKALFTLKAVGLVFALLVPAFALMRGREDLGSGRLWWFVGLSLLFLLFAILLSPERDLQHELASRLSRLLLQLVPALWILVARSMILPRDEEPGSESVAS